MRHLVVPACLCLMTLPGPAGKDVKLPLADLTGVSAVSKKLFGDRAVPETSKDLDREAAAVNASPRDKSQSAASLDARVALDEEAAAWDPRPVLPLHPPLPPVAKPIVERSREEICDTLTREAQANNVPTPFFIHLLFQESRFKAGEISAAGAEGIAQFMPETSAYVGLDNPFDPLQAIPAAARLLRSLAREFGNLGLAAAAYNAGPKRIQDWLAKKGTLPQETQGYVRTVTGRAPETWTVAANGSPALKLPRHAPCQEAAGLLAWNGPERIPLPPVPGGKRVEVQLASADPDAPSIGKATEPAAGKPAAKTTTTKTAATTKPASAPVKTANGGKPAIAQVAAAKHKRGHKAEKVAAN